MSEMPKCPGCGADMRLMRLTNSAFCYVCMECGWDSPTGLDPEPLCIVMADIISNGILHQMPQLLKKILRPDDVITT